MTLRPQNRAGSPRGAFDPSVFWNGGTDTSYTQNIHREIRGKRVFVVPLVKLWWQERKGWHCLSPDLPRDVYLTTHYDLVASWIENLSCGPTPAGITNVSVANP